jgi:3-hydroxyacyl-CoA dehydrogenase/enoyl-CoA hydratase/3-hydroxybutyryl-CoA epimerase
MKMSQDANFSDGIIGLTFDESTGIATLTLQMAGKVNKIDAAFGMGLAQALNQTATLAGLRGVIVASAHRDWCVGADIDFLYGANDPAILLDFTRKLGALYRRLETLGVPVVAALSGSALGGGCELALSCHYRIAVDLPGVQIGLPEVSLGVIPGAGGTQRLPRMLGFQSALDILLQGKVLRASQAKAAGLVDELVPDVAALRTAAEAFIAAHPAAKQPWDLPGYVWPAPAPGSEDARNLFIAASGMLYKRTAGVFKSPEAALSAVHEGASLSFDRALEVEQRIFVAVSVGDQAKDMIRTLWYHRTAAEKHEGLPRADKDGIRKVGILGAGMMGAGLAFLAANRGYEAVLKDIAQPVLDKAMEHCGDQIRKSGKHLDEAGRQAIRNRIRPTLQTADLAGCDLIIEAVVEDLDLKHRVTREVEPLISTTGLWASNTSALPITDLATASQRPASFLGLHFFSPVEQMPLVEVILGKQTSQETLARALAFCRSIKKLPIVVNDGYGFYTTRVFSAYIIEGAQLVAEGHDPVLIEWAARVAGMVVPPLQVFDEITLKLGRHVLSQAERYIGKIDIAGVDLVRRMVDDLDRPGKAAGRGFYDYDGGRRIWPGLKDLAVGKPDQTGVEHLARRIILAQIAQVGHALQDGILMNFRDAEVGAIFGIGFAPNTGGPLSYMDRQGLGNVVAWMDDFAARYGKRYAPTQILRDRAANGMRFFPLDSPPT